MNFLHILIFTNGNENVLLGLREAQIVSVLKCIHFVSD